jgi:hypothetical protein
MTYPKQTHLFKIHNISGNYHCSLGMAVTNGGGLFKLLVLLLFLLWQVVNVQWTFLVLTLMLFALDTRFPIMNELFWTKMMMIITPLLSSFYAATATCFPAVWLDTCVCRHFELFNFLFFSPSSYSFLMFSMTTLLFYFSKHSLTPPTLLSPSFPVKLLQFTTEHRKRSVLFEFKLPLSSLAFYTTTLQSFFQTLSYKLRIFLNLVFTNERTIRAANDGHSSLDYYYIQMMKAHPTDCYITNYLYRTPICTLIISITPLFFHKFISTYKLLHYYNYLSRTTSKQNIIPRIMFT